MAAATDLANQLADRLWTLFEAQATITTAVAPANRNKGDAVGWLRDAIARAPADQRRMEIALTAFTHQGYTTRLGFAGEDADYAANEGDDFNVTRSHEFTITLREALPTDPGTHPVKEAIEQTLLLAGPRLGLDPPVIGYTWGRGESRLTRKGEFPNVGRITTLRINITTYQSSLALMALTV